MSRIALRLGMAIPSILVVACATARIDVDAYVGPLANTDEVLLQQTLAMAIGAKPLLVELRDKLESKMRGDGNGDAAAKMLELRTDPLYRTDYVDPRPNGASEPPWFKNPDAERVNSILQLYKDLSDPRVAELRSIADEYAKDFNRLQSVGSEHALDTEAATCVKRVNDELSNLTRAFFSTKATNRPAKNLLIELAKVEPAAKWTIHLPADKGRTIPLTWSQAASNFGSLGANIHFEFLSQPEVWHCIAESTVLGTGAQASTMRERLQTRGLAVSRSFHAARRKLRRMFLIALEIAKDRLDRPEANRWHLEQIEDVLSPLTLLVSFGEVELKESAPHQDRVAQFTNLTSDALRPAFETLRTAQTGESWNTMAKLQRLRALLSSSSESPHKVAMLAVQAIKALDGLAMNYAQDWPYGWWSSNAIGNVSQGTDELPRAIAYSKRQYGITGGPTDEIDNTLLNADELTEAMRSLGGEHGLDKGRSTVGLDSLATRYLDATTNPESLAEQRRPLLAALAQFAEKLRVMSGFRNLLTPEQPNSEERAYSNVLTAIASSILLQVDSLQRSQRFLSGDGERPRSTEIDRDGARREHQAWQHARQTSQKPPPDQLQLEVPDATSELHQSMQAPVQVLDELLARLRYLQVNATLAHGPNSEHAARIQAAIQLVHGQRTGFASLRPAIEYLRSSSPATSLQQNPLLLTERILGDASPTHLDAQESRSAVALDKQYWRNVNSVIVDGVGRSQYVIAKDDIGNWQVKSVTTDVSELMKMLGGMASFGLGSGLSPLSRVDAAKLTDLTERARTGQLTATDQTELVRMREEQHDAAQRNDLLATHVRIAIQATETLVADMRAPKWLTTFPGADVSPGPKVLEAFEPPEPATSTKHSSLRDELRMSRARFDTVRAYLRQGAGADVEGKAKTETWPTSDPGGKTFLTEFKKQLEAHTREADIRRARILADLRASLRVLMATPQPTITDGK